MPRAAVRSRCSCARRDLPRPQRQRSVRRRTARATTSCLTPRRCCSPPRRLAGAVMAELALSELVTRGWADHVQGDAAVRVRGIKHDSRRCEAGDLFVAVAGANSDRAEHVSDAIARGAVAVLAERPLTAAVPVVRAKDALVALSAIARALYDDPSATLQVVGVTGTNGKTTCTYLVESLLAADGGKPAV